MQERQDAMQVLVTVGLFVMLLLACGVAPTVLLYFWRRKKYGSLNGVQRVGLIVASAFLGFLASFLFFGWINATIGYGFYLESYGQTSAGQEIALNHKNEMVREYFYRSILPPSHRPACTSEVDLVCQQLEQASWRSQAQEWSNYHFNIMVAALPGLVGAWFTAVVTKRRSAREP